MKSHDVTIQMKPLNLYFHMELLHKVKFGNLVSERVNRVSFTILFYNYYFGTLITGLFETEWLLFGGSTVFPF